jgi:hypothetical protein
VAGEATILLPQNPVAHPMVKSLYKYPLKILNKAKMSKGIVIVKGTPAVLTSFLRALFGL